MPDARLPVMAEGRNFSVKKHPAAACFPAKNASASQKYAENGGTQQRESVKNAPFR
jgi:hypothetical protein